LETHKGMLSNKRFMCEDVSPEFCKYIDVGICKYSCSLYR